MKPFVANWLVDVPRMAGSMGEDGAQGSLRMNDVFLWSGNRRQISMEKFTIFHEKNVLFVFCLLESQHDHDFILFCFRYYVQG